MKKYSIFQRYLKGANWLLVVYLVVMVSGCTFRPAEITPEEARILQSCELNGSVEDVAKAVLIVLQELHYTLGNIDMGLGIITAERTSERRLAPISRERVSENEVPDEVQTFCLVAGTLAVVGLFLAWIFGDSDDEDDNRDHERRHRSRPSRHFHPSPVIYDSQDAGTDVFVYKMTINLDELIGQTNVRVTVQGLHLEGSAVVESGPVQSKEFYEEFFNRLQIALNR